MRIVLSDYSGHPFQAQLARELARRGHHVLHVSAASFQTPKGRLDVDATDPITLSSVQLRTRDDFAKSTFIKRRQQEIEMGDLIGAQITRFCPDVVISSNAPLDTQRRILRSIRQAGASFVFWMQDLYGEAILRILTARLGVAGRFIGHFYMRQEAQLLRKADHVVAIAQDFVEPIQHLAGIARDHITVIENWAPINELPQHDRENEWAQAHLTAAPFRIIYSGTLGFKHNPELIAEIARQVPCHVEIFSEGPAADQLRATAAAENLENLHVHAWLPFEELPRALAGADVLLVILEPDAGIFSVPSKVLTYMCVGRPILGAIPIANLASKLIAGNGAGLVVDPSDVAGLVAAATRMAQDKTLRSAAGHAARQYAEQAFDIAMIADRFEALLPQNRRRTGA